MIKRALNWLAVALCLLVFIGLYTDAFADRVDEIKAQGHEVMCQVWTSDAAWAARRQVAGIPGVVKFVDRAFVEAHPEAPSDGLYMVIDEAYTEQEKEFRKNAALSGWQWAQSQNVADMNPQTVFERLMEVCLSMQMSRADIVPVASSERLNNPATERQWMCFNRQQFMAKVWQWKDMAMSLQEFMHANPIPADWSQEMKDEMTALLKDIFEYPGEKDNFIRARYEACLKG